MGNLLSEPVTDKETEEGITVSGLSYAAFSMQGWRTHMEDAHICESYLSVKIPISKLINCASAATIEHNRTCNGNKAGNPVSLPSTEEAYEIIVLQDHSVFAVFDGHGGTFAATFAGEHFVRVLTSRPTFQEYAMLFRESQKVDLEKAPRSDQEMSALKMKLYNLLDRSLRDAFYEVDKELLSTTKQPRKNNNSRKRSIALVGDEGAHQQQKTEHNTSQSLEDIIREVVERSEEEEGSDEEDLNGETSCGSSGTTAVVVLITPTQVLCANAGDSRAIFAKAKGRTVPLSYDHKPSDEYEQNRIVSAGGYVSNNRIDGDLAVARGLGDFRFKSNMHLTLDMQKVTALPDIIVQNRNVEEDEFIVIGCDGIWDVCTNADVVEIIHQIIDEGERSLGLVCEEVMDVCLMKGSKDNMTVVLVTLPGFKKFPAQGRMANHSNPEGGGVLARRQERARLANEARQAKPVNQNRGSA